MKREKNVDTIRVLRIITRMNVGGPAIQVTSISNNLPKFGFDELLLMGDCEEGERDYLELNEINLPHTKVFGLGRSINLVDDFRAFHTIRNVLRDFRPNIVHTHTFKAGLLGRLASMLSSNSHVRVHTFHGHLLNGYFSKPQLRVLIVAERILAKRSDKLVSVGKIVKEELLAQKIGDRSKYVVIPPGIPIAPEIEAPSKVRTKELRDTEFICAWIGRFVEIKRPERIIEIAREIVFRELKIRLVLVGDGPLRSKIEEVSRLENLPITFLGWRKDVTKILTDSDALILTSVNEGTPISIIQAQRLGRPVVATKVGSVEEVMINGKSGFAIDYDVKEFVDRIEFLSSNSLKYTQFSEAARQFAWDRFSEERLVADHKNLYLELLRR